MRLVYFGSLITMLLAAPAARATSAYLIAPHCNTANSENPFYSGICAGIVEAIVANDKSFGVCLPNGVTQGEANLVVYKYASDHPELLHLEMASIALAALKNVWSCSRTGN